jgi:predicted lipid-binding transport protein (Tim44 family)
MMFGLVIRRLAVVAAVALTLGLVATSAADARAGGGFSMGSRGSRTFAAPSTTRTAPSPANPIQRTITPSTQPSFGGFGGSRGFFGGGLFGGLAAGFLGAGLFGLLFGHGLFGGLGGFASLLGLVLQIGLIVLVARFLWSMWQRRTAGEPAYAGGPMLRNAGSGFGGFGGGAAAPLEITSTDYDAFERLLGEVQGAYGDEDLARLRGHVTPEMLSYFGEQLSENASRGVVNKISGVHLLQGDLAEAWREGNTDYATVAMRFALVDRVLERGSGRVVSGSDAPQEVTEVWTFMRAAGGSWLLSAIQQT